MSYVFSTDATELAALSRAVFDKSANLKDMFDKSALKARDDAKGAARGVHDVAHDAKEKASDAADEVRDATKGDAEHKGLGSRIKSAVGGVKDSVARAAGKAEDGLADALHDPLE
eukprot:TRINITY_DN2674_c0_g1_i1.p2 TRINITY_DN2674_c0_g1~~TRINITY_DN2674_c0_g1_i1.p2  ORF type:complete len:115 (-),score=46.47 TRINITY_DN2674_c0_g1_i1:680-1024(-)